jgi:class 3 adenylate cyclase
VSAMDVADWLRKLGLERYEPAFRANEVDARVLPSLTAEDLKDLGVNLVGHRRRLLDAIAALGAEPAAVVQVPAPAAAERRQLTVTFCDLVGSTALSARLDPEDYREVITAYHRAVADVVNGLDGFVAKYMGDGVLVYFGYPQAHEDDAERAVRAGLAVIDAVGRLDVKSVELQSRVGIATGLVVVGDLIGEGSAQEQSVVGETPTSRLACRPCRSRGRSSSPLPRVDCWVISSSIAISAPSRSRASLPRSLPGRCSVRALWRAASRRCAGWR